MRPQPVTPPPSLTDAQATAKAQSLIQKRDFVQKFGLSYLADGNTDRAEEFALNSTEFNMLVDLYKPHMGRFGNPPWWLGFLIVEGFVMGPKIAKILDYRKLRKENDTLREQLQRAHLSASAVAANSAASASGKRLRRRDTKTLWTVDSLGRFVHDTRSKYLKAKDRHERADYNLDSDRLKKHNKADLLKQAFNL